VVAVVVCLCTGCQTMRTFRTSSIEKVSSARNWARDGFAAAKRGQLGKAKEYFTNAARELPEDHRLTANLALSLEICTWLPGIGYRPTGTPT